LILRDVNSNPMPAGSTVAVSSNDVYYTPFGTTTASKPTVSVAAGTPVLSTNHLGGTAITLKVAADCTAGVPVAYPSGTVTLGVSTPKGIITPTTITVNP
jgi:hypothetical protein